MTPDRAIETAADYADALMTSRRAKNALVLILILILLVQLALFFLVRYDIVKTPTLPPDSAAVATTQPAPRDWWTMMHYVIGLTAFLGVALSVVLSFVVMLILNIMLVGRLVGAGRLTSAYIWAVIAVVFLFPWQAFLNNVGLTPDQATFKIPGVLYTWYELTDPEVGAKFPTDRAEVAVLKWFRYVVAPVVAILILLVIQVKSNRGLKQALGEAEPTLDERTTT
jgi:hypothetical protein